MCDRTPKSLNDDRPSETFSTFSKKFEESHESDEPNLRLRTRQNILGEVLDAVLLDHVRQEFSLKPSRRCPTGRKPEQLDARLTLICIVQIMSDILAWAETTYRLDLDCDRKQNGHVYPAIRHLVVVEDVVGDKNNIRVPLEVRNGLVLVAGKAIYVPCKSGPENLALALLAAAKEAADKL